MTELLIAWAIRSTLIAITVASLLFVMRVRAPRLKHLTWACVLISILVLPAWIAWGPHMTLRVLPAESHHAVESATVLSPRWTVPAAAITEVPNVAPARRIDWVLIASAAYGCISLALLLRLLIGTIAARTLIKRAVRLDGLLTHPACVSPLTVGWFRPRILLPPDWKRWPAGQLAAVLRHEQEHARWRDPLVEWVALLGRALFFFHPLVWWLEKEISGLAEEACDQAALAAGTDARDYASYLLDFARSVSSAGNRIHVIGMTMPGTMLSRRLHLLREDGRRHSSSIAQSACLTISVLCAFALLSTAGLGRQTEMLRPEPLALRAFAPLAPMHVAVAKSISVRRKISTVHALPLPPAADKPLVADISEQPDDWGGAVYIDMASLREDERARAIEKVTQLIQYGTAPDGRLELITRLSGAPKFDRFVSHSDELLREVQELPTVPDQAVDNTPSGSVSALRALTETLQAQTGPRNILLVLGESVIADPSTHTQVHEQISILQSQGITVSVIGIPQNAPRPWRKEA